MKSTPTEEYGLLTSYMGLQPDDSVAGGLTCRTFLGTSASGISSRPHKIASSSRWTIARSNSGSLRISVETSFFVTCTCEEETCMTKSALLYSDPDLLRSSGFGRSLSTSVLRMGEALV